MRVLLAVTLACAHVLGNKSGVIQKFGRGWGTDGNEWRNNRRWKKFQGIMGDTRSGKDENGDIVFADTNDHKYWHMAKNKNNWGIFAGIGDDDWKLGPDEFFIFMGHYMLRVEPIGRFKNTAVVFWSRDYGTPMIVTQPLGNGIQVSGDKFNKRVHPENAVSPNKRIKQGKDALCLKWILPDKIIRSDRNNVHPNPFIATPCYTLEHWAYDPDTDEHYIMGRDEAGKFGCVVSPEADYGTSYFGKEADAIGSNTRVMLRNVHDQLGDSLCLNHLSFDDLQAGWGSTGPTLNKIYTAPGAFQIWHHEHGYLRVAEHADDVSLLLEWGDPAVNTPVAWWVWDGKQIRLAAPRWTIGRRFACLKFERFVTAAGGQMPFGLQQCDGFGWNSDHVNMERGNFGCAVKKIPDPDCAEGEACKNIGVNMFGLMKDAKEKNFKRMIKGLFQGQVGMTHTASLCDSPAAPNTPTQWNDMDGEGRQVKDSGWTDPDQFNVHLQTRCAAGEVSYFTLAHDESPSDERFLGLCKDMARKYDANYILWNWDAMECTGYDLCNLKDDDEQVENLMEVWARKWDPFLKCTVEKDEAKWMSTDGELCEDLIDVAGQCWVDPTAPGAMKKDKKDRYAGSSCACTLGCTCAFEKVYEPDTCNALCIDRGYPGGGGIIDGGPDDGGCFCATGEDPLPQNGDPLPCYKLKQRHCMVALTASDSVGDCHDFRMFVSIEHTFAGTEGGLECTPPWEEELSKFPNQWCEEEIDCVENLLAEPDSGGIHCEQIEKPPAKGEISLVNYLRQHWKVNTLDKGTGDKCLHLGEKKYTKNDPNCPDLVPQDCEGSYVNWMVSLDDMGVECVNGKQLQKYHIDVGKEPKYGGKPCPELWNFADCIEL